VAVFNNPICSLRECSDTFEAAGVASIGGCGVPDALGRRIQLVGDDLFVTNT
jgi:enolase